jgi:hypothetical protein
MGFSLNFRLLYIKPDDRSKRPKLVAYMKTQSFQTVFDCLLIEY